MALKVIPERIFLPLASVKLGRFVTDIARPHDSYHDAPVDPPQITTQYTIGGQQSTASDAAFSTTLTSLLSTGLSNRIGAAIELALSVGNTYFLDNSESWFDKTITFDDTRRWMELQAKRKRTVYIIVGYQTVVDAQVTQSAHSSYSVDGKITMPIAASLAATGVVIPVPGLVDPTLGLKSARSNAGKSLYMAPGEQVCAIHYREVKYKFLSSSIDNAQLSKTRQWFCIDSKLSVGGRRASPAKGMLNRPAQYSQHLQCVPQAQSVQDRFEPGHAAAYYPASDPAYHQRARAWTSMTALNRPLAADNPQPQAALLSQYSVGIPAALTAAYPELQFGIGDESGDVLDNFDFDAFLAQDSLHHESVDSANLSIDSQAVPPLSKKRGRPTEVEQQARVAKQQVQLSRASTVLEDYMVCPMELSSADSNEQPGKDYRELRIILEVDLAPVSAQARDWILGDASGLTAHFPSDPSLGVQT
ncbi:hypothetical protein AMS68_005361 [Peltaster fructicola]|uniref:Uncharacterized protein n=1 Tax=Peltaster fructicola TaxID=286661 RepID=A0A6H0XYL7_9PEZI|nr:hypothetical protein AMS68_005361 [Peltaster fructicola]